MSNNNIIISEHGIIFDRNAMLEHFGEDESLYEETGDTWGNSGAEGPIGTQSFILAYMFEFLIQWFLEKVDAVESLADKQGEKPYNFTIEDFYKFVKEGFAENFTEWEE